MLERLLGTETFLTAQGALDGLSARHAALSDNIANVNTPGYKRKYVPFEQALERAVHGAVSPCTGSACGSVKPFLPPVVRETHTSGRADGNNVDVEREMVLLAENTLRYETITQYVGGYFSGLKMVINSGR
jgi:flagellar basal-body rod protein FlgB